MPLPIYDTSANQGAPLGSEYKLGTDRVFRYAKNGPGALAVGTVLQGARCVDTLANLACAAAAVGRSAITVTLDRADVLAQDEYKEGYLYVNDQAGEGYLYDVANNTIGLGEDTTVKVTIKDHIVVALTTSSQATLVKNPYSGVTQPGGDPWDIIVGVSPVAVASNHFFWCQVRGPAVVLQSGGLFTGRGVMLSQRKAGAVEVLKQVIPVRRVTQETIPSDALEFQQKGVYITHADSSLSDDEVLRDVAGEATIPERVIGYCINPRVGTEYALIYLTLS